MEDMNNNPSNQPQLNAEDLFEQRNDLARRVLDLELIIRSKDREIKELRETISKNNGSHENSGLKIHETPEKLNGETSQFA